MAPVTLQPIESLSSSDIDILVVILNQDAELRKWLYPGAVDVPALTRDEFLDTGREWAQKNQAKIYCIYTDKPIGTLSISHVTNDGSARIGYWITSQEWNQGFGSSAFELALEKAIQLNIRQVSAKIDCHNTASMAIWAKHGAAQENIGDNQVLVRLNLEPGRIITRWDKWFSDDNLSKDERILAAPPSKCAETASSEFRSRGKQIILDLACGIGRDTFCLESHGLTVIGADAAFNGLRVAQQIQSKRGASSELVAADARYLPFKDGSFDGVYCFGLLHEFTGERRGENVGRVMGEIRRLLREDGILVLAVLSGEPEAGLPAVQLFSRPMFDQATQGWSAIEIKEYDDVGCTGSDQYRVWFGMFRK